MSRSEKPDGYVIWHAKEGALIDSVSYKKSRTIELATQYCIGYKDYDKGKDHARRVLRLRGWKIRPVKLTFLDDLIPEYKGDFFSEPPSDKTEALGGEVSDAYLTKLLKGELNKMTEEVDVAHKAADNAHAMAIETGKMQVLTKIRSLLDEKPEPLIVEGGK